MKSTFSAYLLPVYSIEYVGGQAHLHQREATKQTACFKIREMYDIQLKRQNSKYHLDRFQPLKWSSHIEMTG